MSRTPRAEAVSYPLPVRLSPAERERVEHAAAISRQSVSDFARDALATAVEDCEDPSSPDPAFSQAPPEP